MRNIYQIINGITLSFMLSIIIDYFREDFIKATILFMKIKIIKPQNIKSSIDEYVTPTPTPTLPTFILY